MQTVTLGLPETMVGVVIDRFGRECEIRTAREGFVSVRVKVAVSSQFYGWLAGLGSGVRLLSPGSVRENYIRHLEAVRKACGEDEAAGGGEDEGVRG